MPESISVLKAKTERLKIWIGIITLVISNIVSIAAAASAYYKDEKENTAKASYKELSSAIVNMSKEQVELAKDVANLRGYMSGLAQNQAKLTVAENTTHLKSISRLDIKPVELPKAKQPPLMAAKPSQYKPPSLTSLEKQ